MSFEYRYQQIFYMEIFIYFSVFSRQKLSSQNRIVLSISEFYLERKIKKKTTKFYEHFYKNFILDF